MPTEHDHRQAVFGAPNACRTVRLALALVALLGCLALAACGGDDDGGDAVAGSSAEAAFPVTIRSKLGSATISEPPQRVVTLDNQSTDDALALGVAPVAMANVPFVPGKLQSWTKEALPGGKVPPLVDVESDISYERVAALRPDLILATHTYQLDMKGVYQRLSRIAPTVHFTKGSGVDSWQESILHAGRALGREDRARELVDAAERDLAIVRERGILDGKTVNLFNADPAGLYAISDPSDFSLRFLAAFGLVLSPAVDRLKNQFPGRAVISAERYDVLDSDLLIGTAVSPKSLAAVERKTLFRRIGAVRDGHYVSLPIGPATSMAFPSLLSVRYATKELAPRLEEAVDASDRASLLTAR